MTKPVIGIPTSDWRIEVAVGGSLGAILHADASLWRFYSPQLSYCFGTFASGGGVGLTIGAGIDIDGASIANQVTGAAGGSINQTLTIHRPFRSIDMNQATLSEISFGLALGVDLTARDFDVKSRNGSPLFSFVGTDLGAMLGAKVNILNWTYLEFNPPFELPVSRWEALNERRG